MPAAINIPLGTRFTRLIVIGAAIPGSRTQARACKCLCDCGNETLVSVQNLRTGNTKSCSCLQHEVSKRGTHLKSHLVEYELWSHIKSRCYNRNDKRYDDWGGLGVTLYEPWMHDFQAFYDYVGSRPSPEYSLDRFPNKFGNYEPGNLRWATREQQGRNKRNNVMLTLGDETLCATEWSERLNISFSAIWRRRKRGLSDEEVLRPPLARYLRKSTRLAQSSKP